jgi:hypothetical protein
MSSILTSSPHTLPESNPALNSIKQEEWNVPCLQDGLTSHNFDHDGRMLPLSTVHHSSNDDDLQHLCFPAVVTTSNTLQQPDQGSPMAISPATLNTPRGSITSFRSRSQQNSPMNMDSVLTTFTSLAPTSSVVSANASVSSTCVTSSATTAALSSTTQEMLNDISASFTIQVPSSNASNTNQNCAVSNINSLQHQTMLPAFHGNNGAFSNEGVGNTQQYNISYTFLQPPMTDDNNLDHHKFPSPPRSPVHHPINQYNPQNYPQHNMTSHNNPPPSYEEFMNGGMVMSMGNDNSLAADQMTHHNNVSTNSVGVLSSNEIHNFFTEGGMKTEPELDIPFMQSTAGVQESNKCKPGIITSGTGSSIPDHESLFTSDTCPETPDSSVKEETDVNSPDTGNYLCLWLDCNEEFDNPKTYVDHVNEAHMETRKGCEEFPCLWKVSIFNHLGCLFYKFLGQKH